MDSETAATHEEIWDDSALVDSWNQALEEYKKYHSIHAKGGTVDDIPNSTDGMTGANADAKPETGKLDEPIAEGEDEGEGDETMSMDESDETSHPAISDVQGSGDAKKLEQTEGVLAGGAPALGPEVFLGTGYYTGLYEGKQQGSQQAK
ncbi:hypothetical protein B0I37DRAFT_432630 [Chaetomium sp. MPI-CAGE-AT-0009]|nr:hypothetical protein B0I37DRAFT_432630 [Chaetomium sp. MPI-CAGE-AT-0009]